jgi:hypothetical protein
VLLDRSGIDDQAVERIELAVVGRLVDRQRRAQRP